MLQCLQCHALNGEMVYFEMDIEGGGGGGALRKEDVGIEGGMWALKEGCGH